MLKFRGLWFPQMIMGIDSLSQSLCLFFLLRDKKGSWEHMKSMAVIWMSLLMSNANETKNLYKVLVLLDVYYEIMDYLKCKNLVTIRILFNANFGHVQDLLHQDAANVSQHVFVLLMLGTAKRDPWQNINVPTSRLTFGWFFDIVIFCYHFQTTSKW